MPRVSVGLSTTLAAAYLRKEHGEPDVGAVHDSVAANGGDLVPQASGLRAEDLDPSSDDIVWFTCDVDDRSVPELTRRLLDVEGVRSAYVVAPEGPP